MARELGKPDLRLSQNAIARLLDHGWPGNVRELQNVIQRAAILASEEIDATHLIIESVPSTRCV